MSGGFGFPVDRRTIAGRVLRPGHQFRWAYTPPAHPLAGVEFSIRLTACLNVGRFTRPTVRGLNPIRPLVAKERECLVETGAPEARITDR
jgi:hypothetical protein